MAQNYTRQSAFSDGDTITATLFNDEYNQLVNTFTYSSSDASATGHRHDGSTGEGGNIYRIGDLDFLNKIEADSTNNRWGFWVEVSSIAVEQLRIQDGAIVPVTDNDIDLGTSSLEFKNLYLDGTAKVDTLVVDETATITGATTLSSTLGVTGATTLSSTLAVTGAATLSSDLTVAGNAVLNGNTTIGNAATDTVTITADVSSNIIPSADSTYTLGDSSNYWSAGYIDALTTTGNVSVGGNLTVTGNATISGNLTFGDADTDTVSFSADVSSHILPDVDDTYDLGSSTKEWRNLYVDGTANIDSLVADTADINGGTIDGAIIATSDVTVGAGKTLDVSAGTLTLADNQISGDKVEGGTIAATTITSLASTTVDTTNIEVTNLKAKDGTAAGSIADATGVVTLASSVLTTTDINGGTIDGATIGATTPAAGTFTTGDFNTSLNVDGTVTADGLTVDGTASFTAAAPYIDLFESDTTDINSRIVSNSGSLRLQTVADSGSGATNRLLIDHSTGDISFYEDTGTTAQLVWDASADALTFGDSVKATFGAGSDLQIYHDGSHSYISDQGTGQLRILASQFQIMNAAGTESMVFGAQDNTATLYYDNSAKLATTSTGIDVTGTVTADGLVSEIATTGRSVLATFVNTASLSAGNQATIQLKNSGQSAFITGEVVQANAGMDLVFSSNDSSSTETTRLRLAENGDISFYEDTGTTPKFFWDASEEQLNIDSSQNNYAQIITQSNADGSSGGLYIQKTAGGSRGLLVDTTGSYAAATAAFIGHNVGIGTTSPGAKLTSTGVTGTTLIQALGADSDGFADVEIKSTGTSGASRLYFSDTAAQSGLIRYGHGTNSMEFTTSGSERMRIDSSGNVGIGTSSPATALDMLGDLTVRRAAASTQYTQIQSGGGESKIIAKNGAAASYQALIFESGNNVTTTERMRIDSSGNWMLGTTDSNLFTSSSETGLYVTSTGQIRQAVGSAVCAYFNRQGTDGDIINLRKDGTTVGSIGSFSGTKVYIGSPSSAGAVFATNGVMPVTDGSLADNAHDLGQSSARWKDLYLSGDIYLSNGSDLKFKDSGGTNRDILTFDSSNDVVYASAGAGVNNHIWKRNGSEYMRLDTSGNLLVGTTDSSIETSSSGEGVNILPNKIAVARASGVTANFNRITSDGDIVKFRKDGTTVGSIGSRGGDAYFASTTQGVRPLDAASAFIPTDNVGAGNDASVDLGTTSSGTIRWRNLYLSGTTFADGCFVTTGALAATPSGAAAVFSSSGNEARIRAYGATAGTGYLAFRVGGGGGSADSEAMRIDSSGNLGIGTTNPLSKLSVQGDGLTVRLDGTANTSRGIFLRNIGAAGEGILQTDGNMHFLQEDASRYMRFSTANTERMRIDSSGNVGIGTTSPTEKLHLATTADASLYTRIQNDDTSCYLGVSASGFATLQSNNYITFNTGGSYSERMRIDSSGNLLVGKSTLSATTAGVELKPAGDATFVNTFANGVGENIFLNRQSGTGDFILFRYTNSTVGSISTNGSTTAYNTSSDYRLKNVDGPITNSGAYIDALKPVQGSWKADGSRFIGLIAHEVQEVSETPIATGEKDGEEMQGMDYSAPELIANLIAEIQSLRARVAQLEGA